MATRKSTPAKKTPTKKTTRAAANRSAATDFEDLGDFSDDMEDDFDDFDDEDLPPTSRRRSARAAGYTPEDEAAAAEEVSRRLSEEKRKQAELEAAIEKRRNGDPVFPYPIGLPEKHKPYWLELVNSKPHDYFNLGDLPLLKLYCRAAYDVERMDRMIEVQGDVYFTSKGGRAMNPLIQARAISEARLLSISTKFRSQPASRLDTDTDKKQQRKKDRADKTAEYMDDDEDGLLAGSRKDGEPLQ